MNYRIFSLFTLVLFSSFYLLFSTASAFESSSANFELHAGDAESITGSSTSATYQQSLGAGGQNATGESTGTTKKVYAGILYWLRGFFTAQYTQAHVRWRNDDGSETTATWAAAEDAPHINFPKNTAKRLRFEVSNEGWTRGSAPVFTLEFAQLSSGIDCASSTGSFATPYLAVPTDYSLHMHLSTTTQSITDGSATTNQLTASNASYTAGQIKFSGNTTGTITITSQDFTELEYGVSATSLSTDGASYCFRVTNNGVTTGTGYDFAYSQYARAALSSGLTPTGDLISAVFDTTGSSDGPAYNSIMWEGTAGTGKARFQLATSDCSNGKTNPPTCNDAGTWTFYGESGGTCNTTNFYDAPTPSQPVEITCANQYHNNQRYYKYKIRICSNTDCATSGVTSPTVTDVVVNWSP